MTAVYTLGVRATWEKKAIAFDIVYACSELRDFQHFWLLTAAKNLSNATAPDSMINNPRIQLSYSNVGIFKSEQSDSSFSEKYNIRSLSRL